MTGLPSPPCVPLPCPAPGPVAATARAWLAAAQSAGEGGERCDRAVSPDRGRWTGRAADAARRRAARIRRRAAEVHRAGAAGAAAVAVLAVRLQALGEQRARLIQRTSDERSSLAQLLPLPDTGPDAPSLRDAAWRRHAELVAAWAAWSAAVRHAEQGLSSALQAPAVASLEVALDAAFRSLLALDDSAAGVEVRAALRAGSDDAFLLDFDPTAFDGDGSAVIAYGAPSAADHVAVVVPGLTTDARAISTVGAMAQAVGAAARSTAPGERTAAVAWIGYDAPGDADLARGRLDPRDLADVIRVAGTDAADEGGRELSDFVGLVTTHAQDVTVVGHSYGSTTAAHAAVDGLDADRLVLLGSPGAGAGVHRASDLHLPVFAAADDLDAVTWIGGTGRDDGYGWGPLGVDPSQSGFGATRLPTDATTAPHLDQPGAFVAIHSSYFAAGSSTRRAVGAVVTGRPVSSAPARTATGADLAGDWLRGQAAYELMSWR